MVKTYRTNKEHEDYGLGILWDDRRSNLYIIDRDFKSKKHEYSANSYLEVLNAEVEPILAGLDNGYEFMQDNAYSYCRQGKIMVSRAWDSYDSQLAPYSPDLKPIEHVWWHLKSRVCEMFPEAAADKSESEY
jgi:hypothetical protein